jgi:hypothetical protein
MLPTDTTWSPVRKLSFRFFFLLFLMLSYCCLVTMTFIVDYSLYHTQFDMGVMYRPVSGVFVWLDKHIFHLGYNPERQPGWAGDNHFGVLFFFSVLFFAIIGTVVWGILDQKRTNYNRLSCWFRLYLRYLLGIVLFAYGINKLIPVQMRYPSVSMMITPFGYFNRFYVLWNSMGAAPGYMIFTGATEVLASLMLFSRRTAVAGYIMTAAVMTNVFALNIFYNINIKMFSGQLLLIALYLLAPYLKPVFRFFFQNHPVPLTQPHYAFDTGWKKYALMAALVIVPLVVCIIDTKGSLDQYSANQEIYRKEKVYDVAAFVSKDTLPPLLTDTLRWKRFLFINSWHIDKAVIMGMDDGSDWYNYNLDTVKKTLTLYDNPDTTTWKILHYIYPAKGQLQLTGKWKGQDIQVSLKEFSVDSMSLNKEKITLMMD